MVLFIVNLSLICIALIFTCKAVIDTLLFHYEISVFRDFKETFWNPKISWKNKWKLDKQGNIIKNHSRPWYYFKIYKPSYIESFPYSSTLLSPLTDALHLFKLIRLIFLFILFSFLTNENFWIDLSLFTVYHYLFFEILYKNILKK